MTLLVWGAHLLGMQVLYNVSCDTILSTGTVHTILIQVAVPPLYVHAGKPCAGILCRKSH